MSVIQVTPETLRNEADKLIKYKEQQEKEMNRLRVLVNSLSSQWRGEAQNAYVSKFNSMEYIYRNFAALLESYAKLMNSTASQMQQTDENLKKQINGI